MSMSMCMNMRCNGTDYLCGKCRKMYPMLAQSLNERKRANNQPRRRKTGNFEKKLPNGTTLYGPKETENRPGHRHGHRGDNFDRSPHSTIGSAALGDAHTYDEHKKNRTKRW